MAFSFKKNLAATGDYLRSQRKILGLKAQITMRKAQVAKIRGEKQALRTAEKGGAVGGKSMPASGGLSREQGRFR